MVWIAGWVLGGTDFFSRCRGKFQRTVNITVGQLRGKRDGEVVGSSPNHDRVIIARDALRYVPFWGRQVGPPRRQGPLFTGERV